MNWSKAGEAFQAANSKVGNIWGPAVNNQPFYMKYDYDATTQRVHYRPETYAEQIAIWEQTVASFERLIATDPVRALNYLNAVNHTKQILLVAKTMPPTSPCPNPDFDPSKPSLDINAWYDVFYAVLNS